MSHNEKVAIGVFGYIGNVFLAVASMSLKEMNELMALILKVFTLISTIVITIYWLLKTLKDFKKQNDDQKDSTKY